MGNLVCSAICRGVTEMRQVRTHSSACSPGAHAGRCPAWPTPRGHATHRLRRNDTQYGVTYWKKVWRGMRQTLGRQKKLSSSRRAAARCAVAAGTPDCARQTTHCCPGIVSVSRSSPHECDQQRKAAQRRYPAAKRSISCARDSPHCRGETHERQLMLKRDPSNK